MQKIKVAISAKNDNIKSEVNDIFGRSLYFLIVDIEDKEIKKTKIVKNENIKQMSGTGI